MAKPTISRNIKNMIENPNVNLNDTGADLVGKSYKFEDGVILNVLQSKRRELGWWITYEVVNPGALPRKLVMSIGDFRGSFGHLFGSK